MKIHQYSMLCASIISQEAALEAILHGEVDTSEMREQCRVRRNYIVNALNAIGANLQSAAGLLLRVSVHYLLRPPVRRNLPSNCSSRKKWLACPAARSARAGKVTCVAASQPLSTKSKLPPSEWRGS